MSDWNAKIIEEFRANEGRVGGQFHGADMVLLHHVGRTSGSEYVVPLVYFHEDTVPGTIYVVASAAGAPTHPQWYANLLTAGRARVEVGTGSYDVTVTDLHEAERDRVWQMITAKAPGFDDYAARTEGIRTIPVLALHRVDG